MPGSRSFFYAPPLAVVANGRHNNLNLIRFLLASAVIFSHSYVALNLRPYDPIFRFFREDDLGTLAVAGFFFISGLLILKSGVEHPHPEVFLASRFLRIFPGLIVAVLLCIFVFGPLATQVPLRAYFSSRLTWSFLSEMWMHRMQHLLPGVGVGRVIPSINAPLWTLPGEWTMYMVTLAACLIYRWRQTARLQLFTWIVVLVALALTVQMLPLPWPFAKTWIEYYLAGSACYVLRRWIPLSFLGVGFLLLTALAFRHFPPHTGYREFKIAFCYAILTIGYHPRAHLPAFHKIEDPSFGLYIYGMPVQQVLIGMFKHPLPFFSASYPLALCLAMLSWRYVESPALKWKRRLQRAEN